MKSLDLGAEIKVTVSVESIPEPASNSMEKRTLLIVHCINLGFFVVEIVAGLLAGSMGLLGDSLDMLADSLV